MWVTQSCPTLCDPMDYSLPGSSAHGNPQTLILEWVAISFPRESFWPRDWTRVSHIAGRFITIWATRYIQVSFLLVLFVGSDGKESACSAGDLGRSPGEGNGYSLQCSCLDNPMDRGAWWATVHRVPKSRTWLKHLSMHACTSSHEKTWRKLRSILLSEKRQLEKATYCVITTLWCYGKCKTMETVKGSVVARGCEWKEEP